MHSKLPTIGIDCRFAATKSGIGRYTRELVTHLLKRSDPWSYVLFVSDASDHGLGDLPRRNNYQLSIINYPHYSLKEQFLLPRTLQKSGISLFHAPHFNAPLFSKACPAKRTSPWLSTGSARSGVPLIATIHDLILHEFPNHAPLPKHIAYQILMKHTVMRASELIAVSEATRGDLMKRYGEGVGGKTSVIHEGISEEFHPASEEEKKRVRIKYELPEIFFLYVGAAKEHKNVQILIDALPQGKALVLVTGGKEAAHLKLKEGVIMLSGVPEEDLPALYSGALCLVSPSLAEGFNFPVLEAMSCECPVIATRRGSTPEVCRDFATLIEPTLPELERALQNPPRVHAGAADHAKTFTWEKAAEETAKLYARILS